MQEGEWRAGTRVRRTMVVALAVGASMLAAPREATAQDAEIGEIEKPLEGAEIAIWFADGLIGGGGFIVLAANLGYIGKQERPPMALIGFGYGLGTANVAIGALLVGIANSTDSDEAPKPNLSSPEVMRGVGGAQIGLGIATIGTTIWAHTLSHPDERAVMVAPIVAGPAGHPAGGVELVASF